MTRLYERPGKIAPFLPTQETSQLKALLKACSPLDAAAQQQMVTDALERQNSGMILP